MSDDEERSSWMESRRLILSQLKTMSEAIKDLGAKVDRFNDTGLVRSALMSKEASDAITDLNIRLSLLDQKVKIWAGVIALVVSVASSVVVPLLLRGLGKGP